MIPRSRAISPATRTWQRLRWLVIAPHADDETLGAGALIAQAAREHRFAGLVYLTDGAGSHPVEHRRALVAARRREAGLALRRLGGGGSPQHLAWPDAAPALPGEPAFEGAARWLAALCRRRRVDAIAVTAAHEPHCDHGAAAQLAYGVQALCRSLTVFEYCVWADAPPPHRRSLRTAAMPAGSRRHALSAHRSQLTASIGDGFRLPRSALRMASSDILYLRRSTDAT